LIDLKNDDWFLKLF